MNKLILLDTANGLYSTFTVMTMEQSETLTLKGITINDPSAADAAHNLQHLLYHLYSDVPIAIGAHCNLSEDPQSKPDASAHGWPEDPVSHLSAVEFMHQTIKTAPHKLTIAAYSSFTNIGALLQKYPEDACGLEAIIMFGRRPYCAADAFLPETDVDAANIVLKSGVLIHLVPMEILERSLMEKELLSKVCGTRATLIGRFLHGPGPKEGFELPVLCGLAAPLICANPERIRWESQTVHVASGGTFQYSRSMPASEIHVINSLDFEACLEPGFGVVDTAALLEQYHRYEGRMHPHEH